MIRTPRPPVPYQSICPPACLSSVPFLLVNNLVTFPVTMAPGCSFSLLVVPYP